MTEQRTSGYIPLKKVCAVAGSLSLSYAKGAETRGKRDQGYKVGTLPDGTNNIWTGRVILGESSAHRGRHGSLARAPWRTFGLDALFSLSAVTSILITIRKTL